MAVAVEGRKRFRGMLTGVEGNAARIQREDAAAGEPADVLLPIDEMADARIVLSNDMIANSLRRGKHDAERAERAEDQTKRKGPGKYRRSRGFPAAAGAMPGARPIKRESDRWPSAPTGSNCCRSPTRSPARSRSTAAS